VDGKGAQTIKRFFMRRLDGDHPCGPLSPVCSKLNQIRLQPLRTIGHTPLKPFTGKTFAKLARLSLMYDKAQTTAANVFEQTAITVLRGWAQKVSMNATQMRSRIPMRTRKIQRKAHRPGE
jgi:hypothetical protein